MITDDDAIQPLEQNAFTVNKAIELSGNGKFQYIILAVAGTAAICVVIENQCTAYVLPMAKCDLMISASEQGFINSVTLVGVILSSHFWGFMTDTWGRIRTLRLTLLLCCLASVASSFAFTSWMMIVSRLLVGFTSAGVRISSIAYFGEFFENSSRPKYFSILTSIVTAANIIQPLMGMTILTLNFHYVWARFFIYRPWRLFIFVGSMITGITTLVAFLLPEGPKFSLAMGRQEEALQTMRTIYHINTGSSKNDYPVQEISVGEIASDLTNVRNVKDAMKLMWNQTWPLFMPPYRSDMIVLCCLMFFTYSVTQGMHVWFPQILLYFEGRKSLSLTTCQTIFLAHSKPLNYSVTHPLKKARKTVMGIKNSTATVLFDDCNISFDVSTFHVIFVLGVVVVSLNLVASSLMSRIGKTDVLTSWFFVNTLCAFGLIWATNFYLNVVLLIFVLSTIAMISSHVAISGDLFETRYRGMAISLMILSGRTGAIAGSNVIGAMLFRACSSLFTLNASVFLLCTFACYYTLRRSDKVGVHGSTAMVESF